MSNLVRALIVPNLMDVIDSYFQGREDHRTDAGFIALCERIAGKEVELKFAHGDAFEVLDNNYWSPPLISHTVDCDDAYRLWARIPLPTGRSMDTPVYALHAGFYGAWELLTRQAISQSSEVVK